jgi:hypothetical protein
MTFSPSASPTTTPTLPELFTFETIYKIIVENGLIETIPSEVYESDLVESLDRLAIEVLENLPDEERRRRRLTTTVLLPTNISDISDTDCPEPNDRDRCEAVTAEVTLYKTEDSCNEFKLILDVAIGIGRLQFHLDEVNPESPVEIIYSSELPTTRQPATPAPTPIQNTTAAPTPIQSFGPSARRSPTMAPSLSFSEVPSMSLTGQTMPPSVFTLFDFLAENSFDGGASLQNTASPQHQAYLWLSENKDLEEYSEQRIIQRYTMAAFYYSTNGDEWFFNDDWLTDKDECDWYNKAGKRGNCSRQGLLENLELDYNNLDGLLPPELGLLSNSVERIVMRGGPTTFTRGRIPSELGYLTRMEVFFIRGNQYSGSIPTELGNWQNLEQLDLSGNTFIGPMPTEFGKFENLFLIDVSANKLTGELPSELGQMTKCRKLIIQDNLLSGPIPSEVGSLRNVQAFMGGMNMFTSMPPELDRLTFCDTLSFYENDIRGTIPSTIGSLRRLSKCFLMSSIACFINCSHFVSLGVLELRNNALTGSIPSELGDLYDMRGTCIHRNLYAALDPAVCLSFSFSMQTALISPSIVSRGFCPQSLAISIN